MDARNFRFEEDEPPIQIGIPVDTSWIVQKPAPAADDLFSLIAATSRLVPFDHQRKAESAAVASLLANGFYGLFMDMGTGKTKTSIDVFSILLSMKIASSLLIICPKPLTAVWEDEIPKQSSLPFSLYRWDRKTTKKSDAEFAEFLGAAGPKVFVINIEAFQTPNDVMKARLTSFVRQEKCLAVVDESSYIKESSANRTKNIIKFGKSLPYRMILTGTEIVNSPLDLYAQFEFLKDGFWGLRSFYLFQLKYAILQDAYGSGGRTFKKVSGYQKLDDLLSRIAPFVYRARKEECLDLPEKIHQVLHVDLSPAQKAAYEGLKKYLMTVLESGEILTVENKVSLFTKFRQIPGGMVKAEGANAVIEKDPPKLLALLASLESTSEQAIIWSSFTSEIEMLIERLGKIGKVVAFYGAIDQRLRDANVRDFQQGNARFFVANPQSAGFGLNLQCCHLQFVYSRHLSPAYSWQAEDRTHRAGQKDTCVYISLVARGTVEERIELLLEEKRKVRDAFRSMDPVEVMKFQATNEEDMIKVAELSLKELIEMAKCEKEF